MMLKLTIRSSGFTPRDSNVWTNWMDFFYVVCRITDELAESCQVLGDLVGRSASLPNSGSQRDPLFMDLGKSL